MQQEAEQDCSAAFKHVVSDGARKHCICWPDKTGEILCFWNACPSCQERELSASLTYKSTLWAANAGTFAAQREDEASATCWTVSESEPSCDLNDSRALDANDLTEAGIVDISDRIATDRPIEHIETVHSELKAAICRYIEVLLQTGVFSRIPWTLDTAERRRNIAVRQSDIVTAYPWSHKATGGRHMRECRRV